MLVITYSVTVTIEVRNTVLSISASDVLHQSSDLRLHVVERIWQIDALQQSKMWRFKVKKSNVYNRRMFCVELNGGHVHASPSLYVFPKQVARSVAALTMGL